jgi:hypothetical protein
MIVATGPLNKWEFFHAIYYFSIRQDEKPVGRGKIIFE